MAEQKNPLDVSRGFRNVYFLVWGRRSASLHSFRSFRNRAINACPRDYTCLLIDKTGWATWLRAWFRQAHSAHHNITACSARIRNLSTRHIYKICAFRPRWRTAEIYLFGGRSNPCLFRIDHSFFFLGFRILVEIYVVGDLFLTITSTSFLGTRPFGLF